MNQAGNRELVPVLYGETAVKILHFDTPPHHTAFESHWHDRLELHWVRTGTLHLICNGEAITVGPGEMSIISPTLPHSGRAGEEGVSYEVLMFDAGDLQNRTVSAQKYLEPLTGGMVRLPYKTDRPEALAPVADIVHMNRHRGEYHPLETVGCLYRLLGVLFRLSGPAASAPVQTEKFDRVLRYIHEHLSEPLSVAEISRRFHYEESYFCRKFKKETGVSATAYIRLKRLEYARRRLETTPDSVMRIAMESGFGDSAYFINRFKELYKISPAAYRRRFQKGDG